MKKNKEIRQIRKPRQYSLVKHIGLTNMKQSRGPFSGKKLFIYLGEIPNMPGHCVVADYLTGKLYSGYHIERFIEVPVEDV
jgi:hypothetical protein